MTPLVAFHLAVGVAAIATGAGAIVAPKGGTLHARAGTSFLVSMLLLGATAAILSILKGESGLGGLVACYFVATAWMAARRRDGRSGRLEIIACVLALGAGATIAYGVYADPALKTPAGRGPLYGFAGLTLFAGLWDLHAILRPPLGPVRRIARHLWRMCFGFFIATGSFFLGQQQVLPEAVRGSPWLFAAAFAPLLVMVFWLARLGLGGLRVQWLGWRPSFEGAAR